MQIKPLIKIASFFYPVKVKSTLHSAPKVSLYHYRNRWQLATEDAIYSDGHMYRPLIVAFGRIAKKLPKISTVLVLGAGLGCAKDVLHKMKFQPALTFVDKDGETLEWAKELHEKFNATNDTYYCEDAESFLQNNTFTFDMVVVDVFEGRVVPQFILQTLFLAHCKKSLNANGILVINYIENDKKEWDSFYKRFMTTFPKHEILPLVTNKVMIAYNLAD